MNFSIKTALLFFILSYNYLYAQNKNIADSLITLLPKQTFDTNKALLLDEIAKNLMYSKPFEAMQYAKEGIELSESIKYTKGKARNMNRLGSILRINGNYGLALEKYFESLRSSESINDLEGMAKTYNNIGILYGEQKDSKKAIEYYFKSKNIAEKINKEYLIEGAYLNLGTDYGILKQYDSARIYTLKAYDMALKLKSDDVNILLVNLGDISNQTKKYGAALSYFRKSLKSLKAIEDYRTISQVYYEMATVFKAINQLDSCLFYAKLSLKTSQDVSNLNIILNSSHLLSSLYENQNPAQAFVYYKIGIAAKDSIFNKEKLIQIQNLGFKEKMLNQELDYTKKEFNSRRKIELLAAILAIFLTISIILFLLNRQKNKANVILTKQKIAIQTQKIELQESLQKLKTTQNQLIQIEKLATLGELTAGIAHEIQNPLNFVNNFSEMSVELVNELKEEFAKADFPEKENIEDVLNDLVENQQKINNHGKRASSIVTKMLDHSRRNSGDAALTDINKLVTENLNLSYHALRAKDKNFNVKFELLLDENVPKIYVFAQDIGRVIINLVNNAFYATTKKQLLSIVNNEVFDPKLIIKTLLIKPTDNQAGFVEIQIIDNGTGINQTIKDKIFQPFFTTKPTGEGTGLGLSLSYDIITKEHNGTMEVESIENSGATFIIKLPIEKMSV